MKTILVFFLVIFGCVTIFAQAPQGINFQAVARDVNGNPSPNTTVNVTIKIRQSSPSGSPIFEETHSNIQTDDCGMFRLTIGAIDPDNNFDIIPWSTGFKWIEVIANGFSIGNQEMLSVPYALYAENSGNSSVTYTSGSGISISGGVITAEDTSPTNEIQTISLNGTQLALSNGGGTITLPSGVADAQTISIAGNQLSILNGNTVTVDGSATNEIQTLSLNGGQLALSNGGGTVTLPSGGSDTQTMSISGDQLSISNGNTVTVDGSATNEIQTLSLSGSQLTLSNGGGAITLPSATYQAGTGISINGSTISNISPSPIVIINSLNVNTVNPPTGSIVYIDGSISSTSSSYPNLSNSISIIGGTITGTGGSLNLNNNSIFSGVSFNSLDLSSSGSYVTFIDCIFTNVTGLTSKSSFTGCRFNNCTVTTSLEVAMNNCILIGCTISRLDRITNSLISNCDLGTVSDQVRILTNCNITNSSEIYVNQIFSNNDCDDSKISVRNNWGQVSVTGNNFRTSSSGFSTNIVDIHTTTSSSFAVNIASNNFMGNSTIPSGQFIRLYGDYASTRCIVKINNNNFIGGSGKVVSYECTGQVDLMVNDNDLRAVSSGLGVSTGGYIYIRDNVTH